MDTAESIEVEVVYALPTRQRLLKIRVASGITIREAVRQSGILDIFPEIDPERAKVGIFGRRVNLEHVLRDGDRIEIYRPLVADPKSVRRARAG
jgi:putative ubiquitin-RnfH superfamily antitoxin RatB of RatAB toxin-antitoxin module